VTKKIRVLIVDDHPIVRMGLRLTIDTDEGLEVVGEAANGKEALRVVEESRPDVVLLDLRMPEMDGLTTVRHLHTVAPEVAILILTTYDEDDLMIQALQAGVHGFLLKDCEVDVLLQTIYAAARKEVLFQPELLQRVLAYGTRAGEKREMRRPTVHLTEREQLVLERVAHGERSKEIAQHMGITRRTVESYLNAIYTKLGVDSRSRAIVVAIELGILPHPGQG
jgi:NarL family two-component system response regulator YdfI